MLITSNIAIGMGVDVMKYTEMLGNALDYLEKSDLDGWLLYDYRYVNPIFAQLLGPIPMLTRPVFLYIGSVGETLLLAHHVDVGRLSHLGYQVLVYSDRSSMIWNLANMLRGKKRIAMEYSPKAWLPRVSRVDAGTLELVRDFGVQIVSSGDLVQYVTQRWSPSQVQSHMRVAAKLTAIVREAFQYIRLHLLDNPSEWDVMCLIRNRLIEEGLESSDGPCVAIDKNSSDPHYSPESDTALTIASGSWVLIDLWARESGKDTVFSDITWVGYVGDSVPKAQKEAFDVVIKARDSALKFLRDKFIVGEHPEGWEVDKVARDYVISRGYGDYFTHRLGHSLGVEVHGDAVNLDGWETHDTRQVIPGVAVTIEPGVYLPEFGMRSEINVYVENSGPRVTTEMQLEVVHI